MSSKIEKNKNKFDNRNLEKINSTKKKISVKEAGITLVALVITIIVLLILAMISISSAVSGNGIFARAQKAGNLWRDAERNEDTSLNEISNKLGEYTDNKPNNPGGDEQTDEDLSNIYVGCFDTNCDGYVDTLAYSHSKDYNFTMNIIDTRYPSQEKGFGNDRHTDDLGNKNVTFNFNNAKFVYGYLSKQGIGVTSDYKEVNEYGKIVRKYNYLGLGFYRYFAGEIEYNAIKYNAYAIKNIIIYDDIYISDDTIENEVNLYGLFPCNTGDSEFTNHSGYYIKGGGKIFIDNINSYKELFCTYSIDQEYLDRLQVKNKYDDNSSQYYY